MPNQLTRTMLGWQAESESKLEKACTVLNCQIFILAAAILTYQNKIQNRIGSWTTLCIAEGLFIILAILKALNIDTKNKALSNAWPVVVAILELGIVIAIALEDSKQEAALAAAFLLLAAASETANKKLGFVFAIFGIIMVAFKEYTKEEQASISLCIGNILCTITFRIFIEYRKLQKEGPSSLIKSHTLKPTAKTEGPIRRNLSQVSNQPASGRLSRIKVAHSVESRESQQDEENNGGMRSLTRRT